MDILFPFPTSASGNCYIMVAIMKWTNAVAIPIPGAAQGAEFFVLEILLRKLTMHQRKCFVAMMKKITGVLETEHQTTTACHPQAYGQVERLNHTLADKLSNYLSDDHRDWDTALPFLLLRHGVPRKLTTDQGKCFIASIMKKITEVLETNHQTTTATLRQMARWST